MVVCWCGCSGGVMVVVVVMIMQCGDDCSHSGHGE